MESISKIMGDPASRIAAEGSNLAGSQVRADKISIGNSIGPNQETGTYNGNLFTCAEKWFAGCGITPAAAPRRTVRRTVLAST